MTSQPRCFPLESLPPLTMCFEENFRFDLPPTLALRLAIMLLGQCARSRKMQTVTVTVGEIGAVTLSRREAKKLGREIMREIDRSQAERCPGCNTHPALHH